MLRIILPVILLFAITGSVAAQTDSIPTGPRPKLGLALSGGGAKGLAHIGVLEVLEQNGIYADMISGTSMGSVVGGLYSIGYSPEQLVDVALSVDWSDYFNDAYPRAYQPIEERGRAARYQLSFNIQQGKLTLPQGLLQGRKIQALLASLTAPVHDIDKFDKFPRPFAAVATNIETGEAYVFHTGDLRRAIRASMAIPSVFSPVEVDGKLLVDGLVVRNLPVSDAFDLGADVVVGVDVGSPLAKKDELNSLLSIVEQTASFGGATSTGEQRKLADFLIEPLLKDYSTLDYGRADSIVEVGRVAARKSMPAMIRALDSLGIRLPMQRPDRDNLRLDSFYVTDLAFTANDPEVRRNLERQTRLKLPILLTTERLAEVVGRLYGSGFFDYVDYALISLSETENIYRLQITGRPGPDWRARFSVNYDTDFKVALLANLTARNVLTRGSVFSLDAKVSENPAAAVEYLRYTGTDPSIGIRLRMEGSYFPGRIYRGSRLLSEFKFHHYRLSASLLSGLGRKWFVEVGLTTERTSQNPQFFDLAAGAAAINQRTVFGELMRDTYDRTAFPRSGSLGLLRIYYGLGGNVQETSNSGEVRNELQLNRGGELRFGKAFPVTKRITIESQLGAAFIDNDELNLVNLLYLGRNAPGQDAFHSFYGLRYMERPVTSFAAARLTFRYEIGSNNFLLLGYQFGYFEQRSYRLIDNDQGQVVPATEGRLSGFGLGAGSLFPFGPALLRLEYNPVNGSLNANFHAGYFF
ncbi:MAG: patatin-like phospholipase family protein [Saprospiraceae bacterium]